MQEDSTAFDISMDSGICEDIASPTPTDTSTMESKIKTYQKILTVLERDRLLRAEQRKRLSQLAEKRQRKKHIEEPCNVCCNELDVDEIKSCVKCINCQKSACRGQSCSIWIPSRSGWECQLCNQSQESISKSTEWLHQQITGRYLSPFSARSEPSLLRNHLSSTPELDRRSEAASSFYGDQKERVREVIEETLAEMLGGSLDNISVNQLHKSRAYLPTWENGEAPGISHVKLKRFIEKVINDAIRLPSFTNEPTTPGLIDDQSLPFFDPKKYQELLATAVLNKIVDSYNYEQRFDSNRDAATDCSDLDNNHNALIRRKVQSGSISSSSIEPESDCSITDPPSNISRLDDFSRRNSNSNPLADALGQYDRNNSSRLNDYLTRHNVPLPDFSIESDSSNEDNASAAKNIGSSWEGNWLFKKKRPGHESPAPVGMLVPCPKEDIKTQIGDRTADELSDLSEAGSDCEDNIADENEDTTQNPLIQNKNIIGGKSPIGIFDELFEQTSLISSSSLPEGDSVYTETKNDYVLGDDLSHDLVQPNNTKQSFKTEEAINSLVDTQTLKNNLSNSKEHEKRPPTKASLEDIPKPKPRSTQKSAVYANTQEIAAEELACSSTASSAIESEGACKSANDDCPTDPTNNTNTLPADDNQSDYSISESMLKKIQCTKASAIQFLVVVSLAPSIAVPAADPEAVSTLAQIQSNGNPDDEPSMFEDEINGNNEMVTDKSKLNAEDSDVQPDIRCIPLPEFRDSTGSTEESNLEVFIPPPVEFSSVDIEEANDPDQIFNRASDLNGLNSNEAFPEEPMTNPLEQCEDKLAKNESPVGVLSSNLPITQAFFNNTVEIVQLTQEQLMAERNAGEDIKKSEETVATIAAIMRVSVDSENKEDLHVHALNNEPIPGIQAGPLEKEPTSFKDFQKMAKDTDNIVINPDGAIKPEEASQILLEGVISTDDLKPTADSSITDPQNLESIVFPNSPGTTETIGCFNEGDITRSFETADGKLKLHNQRSTETNTSINETNSVISEDPFSTCNMETLRKIEKQEKSNNTQQIETNKQADYHEMFGGNELELVSMNNATSTEEAEGLGNITNAHSCDSACAALKSQEVSESIPSTNSEISGNIFVKNLDKIEQTEAPINPVAASTEICIDSGLLPPIVTSDNITLQEDTSAESSKSVSDILPSVLIIQVTENKGNSKDAQETIEKVNKKELVSTAVDILEYKHSEMDTEQQKEQNAKTRFCEDQITSDSVSPREVIQPQETPEKTLIKIQENKSSTLVPLSYRVVEQVSEKEYVCNMPKEEVSLSSEVIHKVECSKLFEEKEADLKDSNLVQSVIPNSANEEKVEEMNAVKSSQDTNFHKALDAQEVMPLCKESALDTNIDIEVLLDSLLTENKDNIKENVVCSTLDTNASEIIKIDLSVDRVSDCPIPKTQSYTESESVMDIKTKKVDMSPDSIAESGIVIDSSLRERIEEEKTGGEEDKLIGEEQSSHLTIEGNSSSQRIDEKRPFDEDKPINQEQPVHPTSYEDSSLVDRIGEETVGDKKDEPICEAQYVRGDDSFLVERIGEEKLRVEEAKAVHQEQSVRLTGKEDLSLMKKIGEEDLSVEEANPIDQEHPFPGTSDEYPFLVERICEEKPFVEEAKPIVQEDKPIVQEQPVHLTSEVASLLVDRSGEIKPSVEEDKTISQENPDCATSDEDSTLVVKIGEAKPRIPEVKIVGHEQSNHLTSDEHSFLVERIGEENPTVKEVEPIGQKQPVYPTSEDDPSLVERIGEQNPIVKAAKPIVEEHPTSEVDCSLVEKTGKEKHSDKEDKLIGETQLVYPIGEEDVSLMEKSKERPKVEEDKPIGEKQSFGKLDEKRADEDNATLIEKISEEKFNNDNANNRSVEQPVCEAKSTFEVKTTCHEEPTSKDKSNCDENTIGEEEQLVNESKPTYEEKTIGEQKTIDGRKSAGVETPNDETISFREEQPFLKCEPASVETPPDINKITSEEESIFEKQPVGEFESTNQEKPTHAEKPTAKEKLNGGEKSLSEDASDDKSTNEEDSIAEENSNSQEYASFNELENSYDTEDLNLSSNAAKDLVSTNASSLDEDEIIEDVISEDLNKESQLTKPQIEVRLANFASEVHSKLANTSMRVSLEAINKALEEVFSTEVDAWEIISTPNMVTSTLTPQSFDDCEEKPFNEEQPVDRGKFTNNIEKFFWDEKPANEEMPHGEREPICEKQPIGDEISASKEKPNGTEKCQSKEQPAGESICANNETSIGEEKPLYEEKVIDKSKSTIEEKPNSEEESSCRKKSISEEDPIGECKSANKQISNDEKNTRIEEHSTSLEKTTNEEKTFNQVIPLPEEKREANSTIEEISCMEAKSSNKENPSNEEIPVDAPSTKDILVEKTIDADPSGARNDEQLCLVETIYTTGGTDDIQLFREHALQASCTGNLLLTQTDDKNLPAAIENQHLVSPELNEELPPEYMDLNGLEIDDAVLVEVSSFTESYKEFKEVIINNIILDSLTTMLDDEEPPLINDGDDNINEEFLTSAETTSKVERENDQTSSTSKILKENSETTEQVESLQSNSYVSPDVTKKEEIGDIPNSDEKQEHYVVFTEIKCSTPSQSEEGYSQRFKKHETTETVSTTKETCMVNIESAKSIAPAEKELHSQPNTGGFSKEPKSNLNEDGKDRVQNEKTSCSAEKDGENMLEAIVDDKSIIKESETKIVVSDNATEYESKIESINQFTCPEGNDFIPENTIADVLSLSQNVQPLIKLASNALPEKANLNQDTTNPILICSSELDVKTEHPINKPEEMPDKLSKSAKDIKTPMIPEQTFKPYEVNDKLPEVLVSPENCQQNSSAPLTASDSLKTMNEPKKEVESSLEFTSDKRIPEKNSDIHISELTKLTAAEESSENSTDSPNVATTAYSKQKVSKISVDALDCQDKTSREFDHQPSPAANSKEHIVTSGLPQESVEKEKEHSEDDKKTLGAVLWKDEIREEVLVTTEVMDPPANIDGEISPSNKKETQYTDNIFKDETNDSKICSIVTEDAKSTPKMFLEGSSILRSKDAEDAGQSVKSELIDSEKSVTGPITDVLKEIQEGDQDNYIPTEATLDQGCVSEIIQHGKESKTSPTVDPEKQSAEPEIGSNDVPIFLQVVVDNPPVNQDKTKESKLGDVDSDSSNLEIGLFIDPTQAVEYVVPDQVSGALVESKTLTPELEPVNVTLATEELQDSSNDDIIEKSDQILKESNPDKTESLQTLTGIKDPLIEPGNGSLQACQQKVWLETTEDQANIAEDNNHVSINLLEVAMKLSAETNSTSSGVITEPSASFVLFEGQLASGKLKSLDDSLAVSLNDETEPSINCLNQVSVSDSRAIIDTSDVNIAASQSEIITEKNSDGKEENVIITSEQSFTDSTVGLYSEASTTLLKDDNVHLQLTANEGKTNYGVPEISSKLHLVQANQTELKNFGDSEGQNRSSSAIKDSTSTNVSGLHNKNTTISIVEAAEGVTSEVQVEAYQPTKPQIESKLAGIAAEVQSKLASANMQISLEAISDALEEVFSTEVDSWEFIPYPCRVKPALTPHNSAEESIKNVVEEELLDFDKQVDKSSEILSNDDDQRLKSLENLTDGDSMPSSLNIKDTLEMIKGNNCNAGSDKPLEVSSPQKLSELPHYDSDQVKSSFSESDTTTNVFDLEHELASNVIESQEIKPDNLEEIQNNPISSEDIQNSSTNLTTNMEITKEITDTELSKSSNIFESLQENESNTFEVIPLPNLSTPVITSEELHAIIEAQKNAMRMNNESRVVAMRHVFHVSFGGATSSDSSPLDSLEIVTESTTPDEVLTEDDVKSMVFAKNDFVKTKEDIKCDLEDCETDAKPHTQENTGELTEIEEKIPTNQQGATDLKPTKFSNEPEGDFKKTVSDNVTDVVLNPSNETLDSEGMDLKTSGRVKKTISEPNIEEDAVFTSDYAILRCAAVASTTDGVEKTILEPNDEQAAAFTSDYETPRFIGDEEYVDPRISLKMNKDCTEQIAASGGFCIESLKKEQKNATTLEESHIIEIDSFEQVSVETPEAFTVMYNAIVPPNSQSDQPKSLKDEFDEINARSEDNIPLSSSQITSGDINNTIEITTTDILNEPEDLLAFENEVENRVLNDSKTDSAADAIQKEVVPAGQTNALKSVLEDHNSRICDISDGAPQQNYFDSKIGTISAKQTEATDPYEPTKDEVATTEVHPAVDALKENETMLANYGELPRHIDEPFIRHYITVENIENIVESHACLPENIIAVTNNNNTEGIEEEVKGNSYAETESIPGIVVTKSSLEIPEISECDQTLKDASENPLDTMQKADREVEQTDASQEEKPESISEEKVSNSSNVNSEANSEGRGVIENKTTKENNDCPLGFEVMDVTAVRSEVIQKESSKEIPDNISNSQLHQNSDDNIISYSTDKSMETINSTIEAVHVDHNSAGKIGNDSKVEAKNIITAEKVRTFESLGQFTEDLHLEQTFDETSVQKNSSHLQENNTEDIIIQQECNTAIQPSHVDFEKETKELDKPADSTIGNRDLVTDFSHNLQVEDSYLKVVSSSSEDISAYDTAPSSFSELSNHTSPSSLTIVDIRQENLKLSDAGCSPCPPDVWSVYPEMKDDDIFTDRQELMETERDQSAVVDLRNKLIDELENLISSQRAFNEKMTRNLNYERQIHRDSDEQCSVEHSASSSFLFDVIAPPEVLASPEEIKVHHGKCKQTTDLLCPDIREISISSKVEVGEEAIVALDACDFEEDAVNVYGDSNEDNYDSLQALEIVNTRTSGVQIEEIDGSFFVNPNFDPADTIPWHAQKDDSEEAESDHTESNESDPELSITPPEIALCYMTPHILDSIPEDLEMAESPPKVETKLVATELSSASNPYDSSCGTGEQSTFEAYPIDEEESLNTVTYSEEKVDFTGVEYCPSDVLSSNTTQQAKTHSLLSLDINATTSDLSTITNSDPHPEDVELSTLPTDQQTCIESSSTITSTSDDTVRTAIESPARKVTVELTNEDVVEAHKRSEATPVITSSVTKSYSVSMSLELTYDPTNNADSQQPSQGHGTIHPDEHTLTRTHAPHPCSSPSLSSAAPNDTEKAPNTQQQQIKFNILKHAAFSQPLSDEEDAAHIGQFSHLLPGSIAEREHKKWYNAVEMPNNPYSREALKRRLSASSDKPIDIPNINSPLDKAASEDKLNRGGSEDEDVTAECLVDYKRYGRDYYINHAKHASGSSKHKLTTSTSLHGLNSRDDKACDKEPSLQSGQALSSSLSSLHRSHSWGDKRSNLVAGGGSTCDIFTARPVRVEESDPILSRATKLEYLSTPDRDFYLLPSEEISSLRSISASEHSLSQAGDSLTPSEDSDTIRVYDLKKQETRLIRDDDESIGSVAAAVKGLSNSSSTTRTQLPAQTPTHARPQLISQRSFRTTIIQRGSTPTAFKFLQPKRRLYDTRRIMSEDTSPVVREEISRTNGTTEKSVIEEDVIPALPSVKALAKVFQGSSLDTGASQTARPKSYSWKSVDIKTKEESTPVSPSEIFTPETTTPAASVETPQATINGVESSAEEPAKESYSPSYEQSYIPAETPVVPPIPSSTYEICSENTTQEKTPEAESVTVSEQINEAATEIAPGVELHEQVIEESSHTQVPEKVEEPVALTESIIEVPKEEVHTPKEPSQDSYSPPYDQKYNPVEPLAETESTVDATKENANEEKIDRSNSLEWKEDNIEIVTAPKDDQQTTPPNTPATEEHKAVGELDKPVIEPTSLLVDISDTLKNEDPKPMHQPTVVEQFLANEKNAALPPVMATTGVELVSELHEEKTAAVSVPASTPSIEVAAVPAENLCETVETSSPSEGQLKESQSMASSELTATEEHTQVVEHTSEQTSVEEHTHIVVPTSVETITTTESASVVEGVSTEETISTPKIAATEPVLVAEPPTPEPVALVEQTRDEPTTETESPQIMEAITSSDSISEKSPSDEAASETTANPINGQSTEEPKPAENGINGMSEPAPMSPTLRAATEQPQQNGSELKRSSEIRFTQEMPPKDRPISPVLVPGKLKSSIAFFENLKNKK